MSRPSSLRGALPAARRTVRHIRPHLRPHRALTVGGLAALLAEVGLRLLEPWPLKFVFDQLLMADGTAPTFLGTSDPELLLAVAAGAIVVVTGLRAGAAYLSTVVFALVGNRILTEVRAELYGHLQRLPIAFHRRARTGDLITRLTSDVGRLQEVAVTAALPLVGNVVTLIGMVAVMLVMDWRLALVSFTALPVFLVSARRVSGRIQQVSARQRDIEGALASSAAESLTAIDVVQTYGLEATFDGRFRSHNRRSLRDGVKAKRLAAGLERRTDLVVALGTGLVVLFGALLVRRGALTPGDLIVFMSYLKNAFKPLRDLAKYTGRIAKAAASGDRIVDLLEMPVPQPIVAPALAEAPQGPVDGDIRFDRVWFYHEGHELPALAAFDLHIAAGEYIGLVGPSGSGKSTILSLLLRLVPASAGRILVDGVDTRAYDIATLRGEVAIVLQENLLFATDVRENIRFGRLDASDAEVERAARSANAHGFISALPDGYDTVLGERGATLSGGQRQRIAIARALLRDAPIVLLDEPTASLDGENEEELVDALKRLTAGRTTIHVSHDLGALLHADRIVVLDDGWVDDVGSHAELLARCGRYARLYRTTNVARRREAPRAIAG